MRVIDARVDNADEDGSRPNRGIPGICRVDVGAGCAGCTADVLADVEQVPEIRKARIVGRERGVHDVVRLGVHDVGPHPQLREESLDVLTARTSVPDAAVADEPVGVGVNIATQPGQVRVRSESDEDLAGRDRVAVDNFNLWNRGDRADAEQNRNRRRTDGSRTEKRTADFHWSPRLYR